LKTRSRVIQVEKFVKSALKTSDKNCVKLPRIEELNFIHLNPQEYEDPRIFKSVHIYTDYTRPISINETCKSETKTKAKAKAKTIVRVRFKN